MVGRYIIGSLCSCKPYQVELEEEERLYKELPLALQVWCREVGQRPSNLVTETQKRSLRDTWSERAASKMNVAFLHCPHGISVKYDAEIRVFFTGIVL